jgi:hypothetical protein
MMKILQAHDQYGWITAIIEGRWVQAKVYDEPSVFGINDGRVSKLAIGKTDTRDPTHNFFDQMDYNYDRGLDFKRRTLPVATLRKIVAHLEALPVRENSDEY